jgi:hypothetical protein
MDEKETTFAKSFDLQNFLLNAWEHQVVVHEETCQYRRSLKKTVVTALVLSIPLTKI